MLSMYSNLILLSLCSLQSTAFTTVSSTIKNQCKRSSNTRTNLDAFPTLTVPFIRNRSKRKLQEEDITLTEVISEFPYTDIGKEVPLVNALDNLDRVLPSRLLPESKLKSVESGESLLKKDLVVPSMQEQKKGGRFVLTARLISWVLKKVVQAHTTYTSGLKVKVVAASNRELLSGRIDTVDMNFDSLSFGSICITGGGHLQIEGLALKLRPFLFQNLNSLRKPYMMYGDVQLTQEDIVNSEFILSLIQLLMDTILERALKANHGVLEINIQRVDIRNRRLNVFGETNIPSTGTRVPFEVSTSAGVRDDGQVILVKDIQVVLNPNSYLQSPPIPVLLNSEVTVDLGDNFSVQSLVITNKRVWIKASCKISPVAPFAVATIKSKGAYHFDLAELLSSIIKMPQGILRFFR